MQADRVSHVRDPQQFFQLISTANPHDLIARTLHERRVSMRPCVLARIQTARNVLWYTLEISPGMSALLL